MITLKKQSRPLASLTLGISLSLSLLNAKTHTLSLSLLTFLLSQMISLFSISHFIPQVYIERYRYTYSFTSLS